MISPHRTAAFALLMALLGIVTPASLKAATYYVSVSGNDSADGTSWATAKQSIQAAVNLTGNGDTVLVTNGVYATGGTVAAALGYNTNRVSVTKAIMVKSLNGPGVTTIMGQGPIGSNAVRCVYLADNAVLSGFTLTGGSAAEITLANAPLNVHSGGGAWLEPTAVVTNCVITGNLAWVGGVLGGNVIDSTISTNIGTVVGGARYATLTRCLIVANSGTNGAGGALNSTLENCRVTRNRATVYGGGIRGSTARNCLIDGNSGSYYGGGAYQGTLENCTVVGNDSERGGGTTLSTNRNCIVYFNTAIDGPNYYTSFPGTFEYSCVFPLPSGTGNISSDPVLANLSQIALGSPCIGKATNFYATGVDFNGQDWNNPPSMGCTEVRPGSMTGSLTAGASASATNTVINISINFFGEGLGRATSNLWNFGDGTTLTNVLYPSHAFATPGTYNATFKVYNESNPAGVSATVTVIVSANPTTHYVDINSTNPVAPYLSWATAATNIQAAIEVADDAPGSLVLVNDGVYSYGSNPAIGSIATSNRIVVRNSTTVKSVNGPGFTTIQGGGTTSAGIRGAWVDTTSTLSGFTIANGIASNSGDTIRDRCGGAVWCESGAVITNCVIAGNSAANLGGGVYDGRIYNCIVSNNTAAGGGGISSADCYNSTLFGNVASQSGGGAAESVVENCLIQSNRCTTLVGGGLYNTTARNCLILQNTSTGSSGGGGAAGGTLIQCFLTGNSATGKGGGALGVTMKGSTLVYNSATGRGGGVSACTVYNSIVYHNTGPVGYTNYDTVAGGNSTFYYSCTTPAPASGSNNITANPSLATNNLQLTAGSPCIDKGNNADNILTPDYLGAPRIVNGVVDIGAAEFQFNGGYWTWVSVVSNGLTNMSDSASGDGNPNLLKYVTGGSPTEVDETSLISGFITNGLYRATFNRNPDSINVTLVLESTIALSDNPVWQAIATYQNGAWSGTALVFESTTTNLFNRVEVESPAGSDIRFFRLRVSSP